MVEGRGLRLSLTIPQQSMDADSPATADNTMSLYHCSFCKDPLEPTPPYKWQWLLLLVLTRNHSCPHCREMYLRPTLSLKNLFGRRRDDGRKSTSMKGWTASPGSIRVAQPDSGGKSRQRRSRDDDRERHREAPESVEKESSEPERESSPDSNGQSTSTKKSKSDRSRSSTRSTRAERERRDLKRRDAVISTLSNQSRPNSYESRGLLVRSYRKIRRRVRRFFGLSSRKSKRRY